MGGARILVISDGDGVGLGHGLAGGQALCRSVVEAVAPDAGAGIDREETLGDRLVALDVLTYAGNPANLDGIDGDWVCLAGTRKG